MYKNEDVYLKIINSIYLVLSRTAGTVPFGSSYLLEEITRGVGESILKEYGKQFVPESNKPVDICAAYLKTISHLHFLEKGVAHLEDEGESVLVTMNLEHCYYQEFCQGVEDERLLFYCPRLGAMQSVLKSVLGVEYSSEVKIDRKSQICSGRILPVKHRLRTELVKRSGDSLEIAGERAVLFAKEVYATLLAAVKEYAPFILEKVLFDTGYRSSLAVAREAKRYYSTPEESLRVCFEEMKSCGLGRIELVTLDSEIGHAVIRCCNSFEVSAAEGMELYRSPRVSCDLLRGKLSACLTVILGYPIICEEMQCASVEGDYCEFHAYPEEEHVRL